MSVLEEYTDWTTEHLREYVERLHDDMMAGDEWAAEMHDDAIQALIWREELEHGV